MAATSTPGLQMNRQTGFMQSARDLTWNYASVLAVLGHRTPSNLSRPIEERRAVSGLRLQTAVELKFVDHLHDVVCHLA